MRLAGVYIFKSGIIPVVVIFYFAKRRRAYFIKSALPSFKNPRKTLKNFKLSL